MHDKCERYASAYARVAPPSRALATALALVILVRTQPVDEHQPQPGESSWQPHTSVAAAHTSDEDTLNARATSFACAAAASCSESACTLRRINDLFLADGSADGLHV